MQALKKWVKIDKSTFALWDNNQQIGTMHIAFGISGRKAAAKLQDQQLTIKQTGFWKTNLEVTGADGQAVAKVYAEKWHAGAFVLEYDNRKYKLLLRNNPLAEWALLGNNNEDVLAYGLSTQQGKASVKITTASGKPNYLFDFILWYLFVPIATEQSADDFTFLALIA